MKKTRLLLNVLLILSLALSFGPAAFAQNGPHPRPLPATVDALKLDAPVTAEGRPGVLNPELVGASGPRQVVVRLSGESAAQAAAARETAQAQIAVAAAAAAQQDSFLSAATGLDASAKVLARLTKVLNAVVLEVDGAALPALAAQPGVVSINPVRNYELDLSETVPYIGATPAVQAATEGGKDVRVAVLDSGIDYTHAKLGGTGLATSYTAAYGTSPTDSRNKTLDGLFPTAKVVGGYDFVGEVWPNGPLQPDPDPIDCGAAGLTSGTCAGGHGTHVADIIGGRPIPDPDNARVRAAHLSPDAPAVDIWVNGAVAWANVPFKAVSGYANLPPGTYNIQVTPAGATTPVVIDANVTVEAGKDYTVAATNVLASITPLVLVDNNSAPAAGNAHVRFVHASPNAPAVDIAVAGGGPVVIGNTAFGEASAYTPVPAGTYPLEVRLAGTPTVVLSLGNITLEDGVVYTAFAVGLVGGTGAQALSAVLTEDNDTAGGGVAPNVSLYAVKVCSAVSSSCSGVALLQGMEFAVDPNGDGDLSDHVHIVNMSLGLSYGQAYDDDLSAAVDAATPVGVLTVASAGNSADRPYITGTPSATYTALAVAQTTVPSAKVFTIVVNNPPSGFGDPVIGMIAQPWAAPLTSAITAPVFYDTTSSATRLGCTNAAGASPWVGTPLVGRIALIDRGTCAVSMKVSNAAAAGAVAAIVANNVAGNVPPTFSFGGGTPSIPGFTVTQAAGLRLRTISGSATATGTIDPASAINIAGSMVASSSRGPSMGQMFYGNQIMYGQLIKPEIGAPGASISAVAGSGTGVEPFGGTSGSAPMVSGAAALLMNATDWQLSPPELKSRLMNTAERNILNGAAIFGSGFPAPITRIGGGEVRVDRAVAANAAAWEFNNRGAALSFGFVDASRATVTLRRTVVVRNYGDHPITYAITPTFRYADDAANGAITPSAPASIRVPARGQRSFRITLTIDSAKLRAWALNSGPQGGNGDLLTVFEYDGYLLLTDAGNAANNLSLPWHVLPRISNDVRGPNSVRLDHTGTGSINLRNQGVTTATVEVFSLIGTGPDIAAGGRGEQDPSIPLRAVGVRTFDGTGFCPANTPIFQFALNTHTRQTHANYPAEFDIYFDTNRDGVVDYIGFTSELGTFASSGQNAFFVGPATGPTFTARFFTDHILNSGNTVVTICGSQIGLTGPTDTRLIDIDVFAFDNYFTGNLKSSVEDMTIAAFGERYFGVVDPIAPGATEPLQVLANPAGVNTTETGLLLLFTGSGAGAPSNNEARLLTVR